VFCVTFDIIAYATLWVCIYSAAATHVSVRDPASAREIEMCSLSWTDGLSRTQIHTNVNVGANATYVLQSV